MGICLDETKDLVFPPFTLLGSRASSLETLSSPLAHASLRTQKIMHSQIDFRSSIDIHPKPIFDPNPDTDKDSDTETITTIAGKSLPGLQ